MPTVSISGRRFPTSPIDLGIAYGTAKAMRRRASIPVTYWTGMVRKAEARGLSSVTLEALVAGSAAASEAAE